MPTTVNELPRIVRWVRTQLVNDATLNTAVGGRFYADMVPEGKAFPACVFSWTPDEDFQLAGGERLWARGRMLVKIVGQTDKDSEIQTAADRVDDVLHASRGGLSDIFIDYVIRKSTFRVKEVVNQVAYLHIGGSYDLAARYAP